MSGVGPFWHYYGGKWGTAYRYPAPRYSTVIEPFAGAAGYSCLHHRRRVQLYDTDDHVVATWRYLLTECPAVIASLPDVEDGQTIDDLPVCQEARLLVGWWLNYGASGPRRVPSARVKSSGQARWADVRERVARDAERIRESWSIDQRPWWEIEQWGDATWFVDPPYLGAGRYYRHSHIRKVKNVGGWSGGKQATPEEYNDLGAWCRLLPGQVIACEQAGASWLPFATLSRHRGQRGATTEVLWSNSPDAQGSLFDSLEALRAVYPDSPYTELLQK